MRIIQIIYIFLGIGGIIKYNITGEFLTLNLGSLFLVGGILPFFFSSWISLLFPLLDIPMRCVFYLINEKNIYKSKQHSNAETDLNIKFGNFTLGQNFNEVKEKTKDISKLFFNSGIKKVFDDEQIYNGGKISFMEYSWDIIIGVTNNIIYKIALHKKNEKSKPIFKDIYDYYMQQYGRPDVNINNLSKIKLKLWNTSFGNIILEEKNKEINVFSTLENGIFTKGQKIYA